MNMEKYQIRNRLKAALALTLDEGHHAVREIAMEDAASLEHLFGTYLTYPCGHVGLYGDGGKVMFFINGRQFDLADPRLKIGLTPSGSENHFFATYDNDVIADFTYVPPEPISWDPYSDEEDDLLLSAVNLKSDEKRLDTIAKNWALG